jgi:hypothetical protein
MQIDVLLDRATTEPRTDDRVRFHTPARMNHRIDEAMMKRIWEYAGKSREELTTRIQELDREWDLERVLETSAATISLSGVLLSAFKRSRKCLFLPAAVLASLLQHCMARRSVPDRLLRSFGVRTRREIDAEKYAMRMLRGDFDKLPGVAEETHRALEAVRLSRM